MLACMMVLLFTVQGFKREWAPFVLTPDFVYVMGGEGSDSFETYKNLCCRAFLTLRRHADLIINLFSMVGSSCRPSFSCPLFCGCFVVEHCLHQPGIFYIGAKLLYVVQFITSFPGLAWFHAVWE